MHAAAIVEQLRTRFSERVVALDIDALDPWVEIAPTALHDVCLFLRDEPSLQFDMLRCITAVDYFAADAKALAKLPGEPRLELVHHLWSVPRKAAFTLKTTLPRWKDDTPGELPEVASVSDIWRTADWHERELYDLSGVRFLGHPNLRRILCPEDWVGYPLRKDYEMPLEYHGIRGR